MREWIWSVPIPAPAERLLLVTLDHLSDERGTIQDSVERIHTLTGMSVKRIKQARDWLVQSGVLEFHISRGGQPSTWILVEPEAVDRPHGIVEYVVSPPPAAEKLFQMEARLPEFKEKATYIGRKWMAETQPTPLVSGGVPGAIKLIERALVAGWSEGDVEAALAIVPTLTLASLEFALRRDRPAPNPAREPGRLAPAACEACGGSGWVAGPPDPDGRMHSVVKCPACSSEY